MISAIITCAGCSKRFGKDKMLEHIHGKPLLIRTLGPFIKCNKINEIIVAAKKEDISAYNEIIKKEFNSTSIPIKIVEGGKERIHSLLNAVNASSGNILITHDGARPLTPVRLIEELIDAVKETGAAMTAIRPTATVKLVDNNSQHITNTLPRESTWIAQTPQAFKRELIKEAVEKAVKQNYFISTDDSELVSLMTNHKIKVVPGEHFNIKVTYPSDIAVVNQLFLEKGDKND